jgi:hypothetical protein
MSTAPGTSLILLLMASALLAANAVRAAALRPDARWTVLASGLVALACAWVAALHAATTW